MKRYKILHRDYMYLSKKNRMILTVDNRGRLLVPFHVWDHYDIDLPSKIEVYKLETGLYINEFKGRCMVCDTAHKVDAYQINDETIYLCPKCRDALRKIKSNRYRQLTNPVSDESPDA